MRLPAGGCDCGAVAATAAVGRVAVGEGGAGAARTAAAFLRGATGGVTELMAAAGFCAEDERGGAGEGGVAAGIAAPLALRLSNAAFSSREVSSKLAPLGWGSSRSIRVSSCSMRTQMRTPPKLE